MDGLTVAEQSRLCVIVCEQCTEAEIRSATQKELGRVAALIVGQLAAIVSAPDLTVKIQQGSGESGRKHFHEHLGSRLRLALQGRPSHREALTGALAIALTSKIFVMNGVLRFLQIDCAAGKCSFTEYREDSAIDVPEHLRSMVRDSRNPHLKRAAELADALIAGKSLDALIGDKMPTTPKRKTKQKSGPISYNGRLWSVASLAIASGLTPKALSRRLCKGWSLERALSHPQRQRRASKEIDMQAERKLSSKIDAQLHARQ